MRLIPWPAHRQAHDAVAVYALHALPAEEALRVKRHLRICVLCRASSRRFAEIAGSLATTAPPVRPTEHLLQRVLSSIRKRG